MGNSPKSGFVAIVGAPNAGKSTLMNRYMGLKLAITSPKPQTTRASVLGVLTEGQNQLVFLDTPGIHQPKSKLHQVMVKAAVGSLTEVDLILWLIDAARERPTEQAMILDLLKKTEVPVIVGLNKIDKIERPRLLPMIEQLDSEQRFETIVPISALNGDGVDILKAELIDRLPRGDLLFPEETLTDQPEKVIVAEYIREQVFCRIAKEVPYGVAVTVSVFEERPEKEMVHIEAEIHVERDSHKGIVIGAKGSRIKEIGQAARQDVEKLLGVKAFLGLTVRVEKGWTGKAHLVQKLGYE